MAEPIRFKFRFVDGDGNEKGFLSKAGAFDGETLVLDRTELPVMAVVRAERRFNRLILWLLQKDGEIAPAALAMRSNLDRLLAAIVETSSARWADAHRRQLEQAGRGGEFRTETCPRCRATLDLSGRPASPQVWCHFCDATLTLDGSGPPEEATYAHCDECGFYAQPKAFTVFYFYFLLVIWGYRHRKAYICNTCMRGEAWKMLFGNLLFLLGVPTAILQLSRAYFGGSTLSRTFAGLDRGNALAKRGRPEQAAAAYAPILSRVEHCAGLHYNEALAYVKAGRLEEAVGPLTDAITDCSNYGRAGELLAHCYETLGLEEELKALKAEWGEDEEGEE